MLRVALRCHADHRTGSGHLVRCLALAEKAAERGHEPVVVGHLGDAPLVNELLGRGVEVRAVSDAAGEADRVVAGLGADLVHVDDYDEVLLPSGVPVSSMRDGDYGRRAADLVVDPTLGAERHPAPEPRGRIELRGAAYAPIRRDIASRHGAWRDRGGSRVLVTMGSTDPHGLTPRVVALLLEADLGVGITVVLGRPSPELAAVRGVTVRPPTPDFADLALEHDLVVSASGTTVSELACLGVPMAVVRATDNQADTYAHVTAAGAAWGLGSVAGLVGADEVHALWSGGRTALSRTALALVDGRGVDRIVTAWETLVAPTTDADDMTSRRATMHDAATLLAWRNDEGTRRVSRNSDVVGLEEHLRWLEGSLRREGRLLFVVERRGLPVGTVRWDLQDDGSWEVSITVAPEARGGGAGKAVLAEGERALRRVVGDTVALAAVHSDNAASNRLFARAGYGPTGTADSFGFHVLAKELRG